MNPWNTQTLQRRRPDAVQRESQWQNGLAEQSVCALKDAIYRVTSPNNLNYAELCCLLQKLATRINDRPLGLRHLDEEVCVPVTPNSLLLGRTGGQVDDMARYEDAEAKHCGRIAYVEAVEKERWDAWYPQVFGKIFPFENKAVTKSEDVLRVSDVCLLHSKPKLLSRLKTFFSSMTYAYYITV